MSTSVVTKAREATEEAYDNTREFVGEYPLSSSLTMFGLGLGTGVAAVLLFTNSRARDEGAAHRLGRRIMDTLGSAVPDSWRS